jgi:hypothetical protein
VSFNSSGGYLIRTINIDGLTVTGNNQSFHGTPAQFLVADTGSTTINVSGNTVSGGNEFESI